MSVFTQFDTSFGDGFFSGAEHHVFFGGADHDGGLVGPELVHEHGGGLYHGIPSADGGVDIYHGGQIVDHQHDMHIPICQPVARDDNFRTEPWKLIITGNWLADRYPMCMEAWIIMMHTWD